MSQCKECNAEKRDMCICKKKEVRVFKFAEVRTIKEAHILIDQIMENAGLDTVLEKVGFLSAMNHDYLQDLRDVE